MGLIMLSVGILVCILYLVMVAVQAWYEVKDAPRVPMFLCDRHGAIPAKYTLKLNTPVTEKPIEICPMCFEQKMKAAKKGTL